MTKKITSILLVLVTLFTISSFSFTADAATMRDIVVNYTYYQDVSNNHWANKYVCAANHYGLMRGVGNNKFNPDEPLKIAHFYSVMNKNFKYMGYSGDRYNYNNIARSDAVYQLWATAGYPWAPKYILNNYIDRASIPSNYEFAWSWCIQNGIVSGDNGRLKPWDCLSRAESAALFVRYYCLIKEGFRVANINVVYPSIVTTAQNEIGNYGGYKYKNWYGLDDAWCAMFVSWCAYQCGYMNYNDKFASCPGGQSWFKSQGKWNNSYYKGGNYIPKPGDIIFFDWDYNNRANHVGIVEKVQNNTIYTIEGNCDNSVKSCSYSLYSEYVLGYGILQSSAFTISINANGGIASTSSIKVSCGEKCNLSEAFVQRNGYKLKGWYLYRPADNKWFAAGKGWFTEAEINSKGYTKNLYIPNLSMTLEASWFYNSTASNINNFIFYAVW